MNFENLPGVVAVTEAAATNQDRVPGARRADRPSRRQE
jgi:hypothetical protein